jgi:hypothetical protein
VNELFDEGDEDVAAPFAAVRWPADRGWPLPAPLIYRTSESMDLHERFRREAVLSCRN